MIIMADESRVYAYDLASKQQSTEWVQKGQGSSKRGKATKLVNETIVITLFDYHGMIYTHM